MFFDRKGRLECFLWAEISSKVNIVPTDLSHVTPDVLNIVLQLRKNMHIYPLIQLLIYLFLRTSVAA